jgi:hypothetical protein
MVLRYDKNFFGNAARLEELQRRAET